jgi:hypothetical protein
VLGIVERFGTTTITLYNGADDLPAGPGYATHSDLPAGGARDLFGSGWGRIGARVVRKSGELIADTAAELQTAADALRALSQQRDTLYVRMDSGAVRTVTARCTKVAAPRTSEHTLFLPVQLEWVILDPCFRGEHHGGGWHFNGPVLTPQEPQVYFDTGRYFDEATGDVITLSDAPDPTVNFVANNGNTPIYDPIITITATANPISYVKVTGTNCEWEWTGTLAATKKLVVNCGALTVTNDGVDAYSGFGFTADHHIPDWFQLLPGNNNLIIEATTVSTDATATFDFSDGYA